MKRLWSFGLILALLPFFAAGSERRGAMSDSPNQPAPKPTDLAPGAWGGQHIGLQVTETGAEFEFDCARGEIKGKIAIDRLGRFRVAGTYTEERGGPARQSDEKKGAPVIYAGRIRGEKMTLAIRHEKTGKRIGSFTLGRGEEPFIVKCR